METSLFILAGALLIDALLGEYPRFLHPVVWLGKIISLAVHIAPRHGWWRQFLFGAFLAVAVSGGSAALAWLILDQSAEWPWLQMGLAIFLLKASMALRELGRAAKRVCRPLQEGNLEEARAALRSLCSRNPANLDAEELLEATIESLAENLSDSWVAPLFYYTLLGVPGALAYRAINTLDAMIGYRGKYEALGKASARLDDLANWIPARLTAGFLLLIGWFLGHDVPGGWTILRRDSHKTPSPNAGRPMAVMAGLLQIRLQKKGVYLLGDPLRPVTLERACRAWKLVRWSGIFAIFCLGGIGCGIQSLTCR